MSDINQHQQKSAIPDNNNNQPKNINFERRALQRKKEIETSLTVWTYPHH